MHIFHGICQNLTLWLITPSPQIDFDTQSRYKPHISPIAFPGVPATDSFPTSGNESSICGGGGRCINHSRIRHSQHFWCLTPTRAFLNMDTPPLPLHIEMARLLGSLKGAGKLLGGLKWNGDITDMVEIEVWGLGWSLVETQYRKYVWSFTYIVGIRNVLLYFLMCRLISKEIEILV